MVFYPGLTGIFFFLHILLYLSRSSTIRSIRCRLNWWHCATSEQPSLPVHSHVDSLKVLTKYESAHGYSLWFALKWDQGSLAYMPRMSYVVLWIAYRRRSYQETLKTKLILDNSVRLSCIGQLSQESSCRWCWFRNVSLGVCIQKGSAELCSMSCRIAQKLLSSHEIYWYSSPQR